jgi:hypothetical protein
VLSAPPHCPLQNGDGVPRPAFPAKSKGLRQKFDPLADFDVDSPGKAHPSGGTTTDATGKQEIDELK